MAIQFPNRIDLTPEEEALASRIDFDYVKLGYDPESCLSARELTKLLIERDAVPEVRLDYFCKPEYNVGSTKSRYEQFEANGVRGEEVFESPHFFEHLKYFVYGPNLSDQTKEAFFQIAKNDTLPTSVQRERLRDFSRNETRRLRLNPKTAAEEFYKLALECTSKLHIAESVRDAVRAVNYR